jgi:hypothetical protein
MVIPVLVNSIDNFYNLEFKLKGFHLGVQSTVIADDIDDADDLSKDDTATLVTLGYTF